MPDEGKYRIKLTGPEFTVEQDLSEELSKRIAMLVLSGGKHEIRPPGDRGQGKGQDAAPTTPSNLGDKSLGEYLEEVGVRKFPETMTAIGHYLCKTENKESFTMAELRKGFHDAKEAQPKNPSRDINTAIKSRWIAPRDDDSYYVTSTGRKALEVGFTRKPSRKMKKT